MNLFDETGFQLHEFNIVRMKVHSLRLLRMLVLRNLYDRLDWGTACLR
jgi:hypothetical protein